MGIGCQKCPKTTVDCFRANNPICLKLFCQCQKGYSDEEPLNVEIATIALDIWWSEELLKNSFLNDTLETFKYD